MAKTASTPGRTRASSAKGSSGVVKADPRLARYAGKRDFQATPEPTGASAPAAGDRFVVQKHNARRLHFDLRLEMDGVLKSWAITKGPSLDPTEKRLAVQTEDHPLDYLEFEGVIPKGEYGGGSMIVWDQGRWRPTFDPRYGLAKGHLEFELEGERLNGRWHLVRMKPRAREKTENWLLIKAEDEFVRKGADAEVGLSDATSVLSKRTNAEPEKAGTIRKDHAARLAVATNRPRPDVSKVSGAKKGLLPIFVKPSLASPVEYAPSGPEWIHEIKFDGYRVQARIDGGKVKLLTRSGLDWTDRFQAVAKAVQAMKLDSGILDGEVVVEDKAGASDFSALQAELSAGRSDRMLYQVFDLLYLSGTDLTRATLINRKAVLENLLGGDDPNGVVRYSSHIEGDGQVVFRHACRLGLEGIVSKRRNAPYRTGRSPNWLKTKCTHRQEFVVAGFVRSTVSSKAVGSLVLGLYEGRKLVHVGRVGTGFTEETARSLFAALDGLRQANSPFSDKISTLSARGVVWVAPELVADVEIRGWTADGQLRHASFKGLREDKPATEVTREGVSPSIAAPAVAVSSIKLTHPDRVLWPDIGLTKQGLADYYAEVVAHILPHIVGRPLSLVRCPTGINSKCFFQKHPYAGMAEAVRSLKVGKEQLVFIDNFEGLLALVQGSALEIHPWGSTVADLERPDRIVFDLDPDEGLQHRELVEGVLAIKGRLDALKLDCFLKTTGGKGFHIVVPITPKAGWDEVKEFARGVARDAAKDAPNHFTDNSALVARRGKIYIDYLRNGRGATAIGAYSTRARPRAAVSTPLSWDELTVALKPDHFTVENLPTRLSNQRTDPWPEFFRTKQLLPSARKRRS